MKKKLSTSRKQHRLESKKEEMMLLRLMSLNKICQPKAPPNLLLKVMNTPSVLEPLKKTLQILNKLTQIKKLKQHLLSKKNLRDTQWQFLLIRSLKSWMKRWRTRKRNFSLKSTSWAVLQKWSIIKSWSKISALWVSPLQILSSKMEWPSIRSTGKTAKALLRWKEGTMSSKFLGRP